MRILTSNVLPQLATMLLEKMLVAAVRFTLSNLDTNMATGPALFGDYHDAK